MAKTDEELRNAALIDLTKEEKAQLRRLLTSEIEKLRTEIKADVKSSKSKYTTVGTGIQPKIDISPSGVVRIPYGDTKQEKIDALQRKVSQIEQSIQPAGPISNVTAPPVSDPNAAKGGGQYQLVGDNEDDGLIVYLNPEAPEDDKGYKGYLIPQSTGLRGGEQVGDVVRPKTGFVRYEHGVRTVEAWNQAVYDKYSQDPEATANLKKRLVELRYLPQGTVIDGVPDAAFRAAMDTLGAKISTENFRRLQSDPRQRMFTLEDGLDYLSSRGGAGATTTGTRTTISTKDEAYATLNTALRSYLGREATEEELSQFTAQLNAFERKSPTVSTTTGTDTTVSGGAEGASERMATEFARSQEGSAAFRAGTYYYDALLDAIDNPLF
jgi:hypothetical protein